MSGYQGPERTAGVGFVPERCERLGRGDTLGGLSARYTRSG
jgi:hypothetical protein